MVLLGILLVIGQGAIVCAALHVARRFGEYAASNALLSEQIVKSLAEIARIKARAEPPEEKKTA